MASKQEGKSANDGGKKGLDSLATEEAFLEAVQKKDEERKLEKVAAPTGNTSIEAKVGTVRNKKTGEVQAPVESPAEPEVDKDDFKDYDALINDTAWKPLSTGESSRGIPENIRAFEGTMRALIPKTRATVDFHAQLAESNAETNRLRVLEAASRKAKKDGKDSFEFTFNGEVKNLTLEQAEQSLRDLKAKLEAGRSTLQDKADELLRNKEVLATAQKLREKTVEKANPIFEARLASAKTEKEKTDIERDRAILGLALNHVHNFQPNGGLETFGHEKRARFANTHSAIQEIYKKYGIKPADESELKTKAPRTPRVVEPATGTVTPAVVTAPATAPTVATVAPKTKITPTRPKIKKVPTAKPYEPKNGRKMREEDLNVPEKEIGHRKMLKSDINYQDVPAGAREMIEDDLNVPEKTVEHGPREMIERDYMPASEYGEVVTDKMPNAPGAPWVKMSNGDLDMREPLTANPLESLGLTPEQMARIEAHRSALSRQGQRINTEAERRGLSATMNQVASWYNGQPMWKKVGMGLTFTTIGFGGMLAGGAAGGTVAAIAFGTGRALGTFGTWAMLNGVTSRMPSRETAWFIQGAGTAAAFFLLPKLAQWIDMETGWGKRLAEYFGLVQTPAGIIDVPPPVDTPPPTIESYLNVAPPIDTPPPTPSEFGIYNPPIAENPPEVTAESFGPRAEAVTTVTIAKGDTIWGVVEKGLGQRPEFTGLDRAGKDLAIDTYMKKMGAMTPDQLRALGISSGDINKIQIGEKIQLPVLSDQALFDKAITDASALTPEQKANILKYRAGMLSGGLETAAYVPPSPEVAPSLESNVTANYKNSLEYIFGNRQDRYRNFVSWKNPDYFINAVNYTPDVIQQETRMQGVEIERLRDTLYQYKQAGLTGRTVEQLLQAGARSRAGL